MHKKNRRQFLNLLATIPAATLLSGSFLKLTAAKRPDNKNHMIKNGLHAYTPGYVSMQKSGQLKQRGEELFESMQHCLLCPRECGANRLNGERGHCKANANLEISSASPHFGEERELVGRNGSGTIFFTNCSLLCVFCINYEISHQGHGSRYSIRQLANMMMLLQRNGCHNINVVTPSHYLPHIMLALDRAASRGLNIPLVYNTCGWEKKEILASLDGVADIYLADYKYADNDAANKYSPGAVCYPEVTQEALKVMHKQVGVATADPDSGLIYKGLMIRHLVMPENVARSDRVVRWIANNLPKDTYLNIMSQYTPMYKAFDHPEIARHITRSEYQNVITTARNAGLTNLRLQMQ